LTIRSPAQIASWTAPILVEFRGLDRLMGYHRMAGLDADVLPDVGELRHRLDRCGTDPLTSGRIADRIDRKGE
jgi:hypothetical protein